MLATVGYLTTQAGIHLPGNDGLYSNPNPIDAVFQVGPEVMLQIVGLIGVLESLTITVRWVWKRHEGVADQVGEFTNQYMVPDSFQEDSAEAAELKLKN